MRRNCALCSLTMLFLTVANCLYSARKPDRLLWGICYNQTRHILDMYSGGRILKIPLRYTYFDVG